MSRISSSVRRQVQKRAESRCEYCRIPDHVTHFSHQIDHIIPPRHGGSNELPNLAWACFHCNNNKGTDIATYDLTTRKPVFLYNPL
jgi:5-methylcytosine-specific restriction endonuclease McrA